MKNKLYVIRRKSDNKYLLSCTQNDSLWVDTIEEAKQARIYNDSVLSLVMVQLCKQGYSVNDVLIYTVKK